MPVTAASFFAPALMDLYSLHRVNNGDACKTLDTQRGAEKGASGNYLASNAIKRTGIKLFIERISFPPTIFQCFSEIFVFLKFQVDIVMWLLR
jgi:hypothetical protein